MDISRQDIENLKSNNVSQQQPEIKVRSIHKKIEDILEFIADDRSFKDYDNDFISLDNSQNQDTKNSILKDVQANILKGTKHKYTLFCFLTFDEVYKKDIITWIKNISLTSAHEQEEHKNDENANAISLFLSYEGYIFFFDTEKIKIYLKTDNDDIIAFKEGLSKRCPKAFGGIRGKSREKNYEQPVHALVMIASNNKLLEEYNKPDVKKNERDIKLLKFLIDETTKKTEKTDDSHNYKKEFGKVFFEIGMRNPEGSKGDTVEWFGFKDGVSNPRFFPSENPKSKPNFKPDKPSKLNLVLQRDKLSTHQYACGSFVVFLKLEQNVEAFNKKVEKLAEGLKMSDYKGLAAALLIGRHKDGTPLHRSFKFPSNRSDINQNDFNFEDDPDGSVCPFNAHIRKANPRDGYQTQIVRRGKIYGHQAKSENRGILFLSYQSSLRNFEDIVNNGLYAYNYKTKHVGQDVLFGESNNYASNQSYRNVLGTSVRPYINVKEDLVTFKGGHYFFAPSLTFIQYNLEKFM